MSTYPATTYADGVELTITSGNQLHEIINGTATEEITTESGMVPSVRKAIADSMLFKQAIDWAQGSVETDPLQTRNFNGTLFWAPAATTANPIAMGASPVSDSNWSLAPVGRDTVAMNANLISNSHFEFAGTVTNPPDAVARNYDDGDEIFSGIYAKGAITNVTFVDGVLNGFGELYVDVIKNAKMKEATSGVISSIAGTNGEPYITGSSVADAGDYYRVTFSMNNTFSVKLEQGSVATGHKVSELSVNNLSNYTDIVYKASGGKSAVDVMLEANTDIGNIYNTGGTSWLKVSDSNGDIRDFEAVSSLHTSDFINNSTSTDDGDKFIDLLYVYFEIENSYQNSGAVDAWRFSGKNRHIHFNKKVTSTKPLPFIQACIYTSSKSINDFSRSIDTVDFMYTPSNLMSEAVKPLLYIKQPEGSYVLNTEPLKGTPDNEFNAGDSDYITGSSNVDFNIYVGTSPSVRLGLNSTGTTHSTGTFGIGVQEGGTDNVSAPQVGWYTSKAWASLYKKPYVFGRIQSLVTNDSIAGTQIQSPYLSRNGIADVDTDAVYTNSELSSSGKHKTSGLTALGGSDYHLSSPIIEHYKCPIVVSGYRSEVMITKPHIEAYGGAIDHSIIINGDAKIDVNNWEHLYATGGAEVIYTIGAVSGTRVYLRGGPMQLGPVNGLIGGDSSQPVLYVDHVSEAVSDYGAIGNVDLILGVQNPILGRTIFVDADNGDDKQFGTRLANPIKTIEAAVKRVNLFFDKLDMTPYITLISDVSLLANSTLKTPVSIDIQSGNTLNSNGFYIELDTDISLNGNGGIAGSGSPFRSGQKICNIVVNGPTISTYSIVTSTNASQVNVSQISGNTSGISIYVDGGGQSPVVVSVNGGIRNTGIDSEPVATNHFILGSKFS